MVHDNWNWRITTGIGADPGYHQIANRETARLIDAVEATAGAEVKQYPYLGNIAQQYWQFVEVGSNEDDEEGDGGTSSRRDGGAAADDEHEGEEGGQEVDDEPREDRGVPGGSSDKPAASGCALSEGLDHPQSAWWLLVLAIVVGARRRSFPRTRGPHM